MYTQFFNLAEHPFSIAPNPGFLYMSERHREALAHLTFGQGDQGGFILLTGEVGTGKTTVSRYLLRQMPENSQLAFILNPALTEVELLASVCDEFGIEYDKKALSLKLLFDQISKHLLANHRAGRNSVLLIDEAQHLRPASLEQLRLLTNLETDEKKLLQVILIGQPELQQLLKQPNLRQLAQRITARYHLMPLTAQETRAYILHRLAVAGCKHAIFSEQAMKAVFGASAGIPRLINLICDRSLMAAYGLGLDKVDAAQVMKAAQEVIGFEAKRASSNSWIWLAAGAVASLFIVSLFLTPGSAFHVLSGQEQGTGLNRAVVTAQPVTPHQAAPSTAPSAVEALEPTRHQQPIARVSGAQHAAAPVKRPPLSTDKQLANLIEMARDKRAAFQDLFRVWGTELEIYQATCRTAFRTGLSCVEWHGDLTNLRENNIPAVLELHDESGAWYAVLYGVDDGVTLLMGDTMMTVTSAWLNAHWDGNYTLFWQPPPRYIGQLMVGAKGAVVQWLETHLAQVQLRQPRTIKRFDRTLKKAVQMFQREQFLVDDGIAGVQTLLKLSQQVDPAIPTLNFDPAADNDAADVVTLEQKQ